jgi:LPS-assembly protein
VDSQWLLCPAWPPERPPGTDGPPPDADTPIDIDAPWMDGEIDGLFSFSGGVNLRQGSRLLQAESLHYDAASGQVGASGDVRFAQSDIELRGAQASFDLDADIGSFEDGSYRLIDRHARGSAARIEREGPELTRLENLLFTTCPEGRRDWELTASRMRLDHGEGVGTARNVLLRFYRVPLFYSPWISFPLDEERKTGFLAPDIGKSSRRGYELAVPWYWNIAPNMDATLTPYFMSLRGTGLDTEYRFMTRRSTGEFKLEYLPDDDIFGDNRHYASYRQRSRLPAGWRLDVNLQEVSDEDYFFDLGNTLSMSSRTHLPQRITLSKSGEFYRFRTRFEAYQTVDPTIAEANRPYRKLPEVDFRSSMPIGQTDLNFQFDADATSFDRRDRLTGERYNFHPRVRGRFGTPGWFLAPSLGVQHTRYELRDAAIPDAGGQVRFEEGGQVSLSRTAPIFSLDSGMIFERPLRGSDTRIQTLEPRAFYLYIPHRDQTTFPRFDTRALDFNFNRLFMEDRFIGADRLGDANQLTTAITSRALDRASGRTLASISLGQIHYFDDRRVQLRPDDPETGPRSELVAEMSLSPTPAWNNSLTALWDPEDRQTTRGAVQFQYRPADRTVVNLGYRYQREREERPRRNPRDQADVSMAWPLTSRIRAFGRWNYSFEDEETLERFAGIEYGSCCWALRAIARRYVYNREGDIDRTIMIQLELRGLAGLGRPADQFLSEGILGYDRRED